MRAIFIVAGVALLTRFEWILYFFGGFLLITGVRLWNHKDSQIDPQNNAMIRVARKFFPGYAPILRGIVFCTRRRTSLCHPALHLLSPAAG